MIYHYNIKQGSDEWRKIRELKLTASKAQAIATGGAGLNTLVKNLVIDYITRVKEDGYKSEQMERGNLLEPIALLKYEFEKKVKTNSCGFIEKSKFIGVSPDALVGEDGLVECKARDNKKHFDLLLNGKVDSATVWQMQMQMLVSRRKWCDFISYNPNFFRSLFVKRFYKDEDFCIKINQGLILGEKMIIELLENPIIKEEIRLKTELYNKTETEIKDFEEIEEQEERPKNEIIFQNSELLFGI